jgi:hypothetical protein
MDNRNIAGNCRGLAAVASLAIAVTGNSRAASVVAFDFFDLAFEPASGRPQE